MSAGTQTAVLSVSRVTMDEPLTLRELMRISTLMMLFCSLLAYGIWKYTKVDVYAQSSPPEPIEGQVHQQRQDDRIGEIETRQAEDQRAIADLRAENADRRREHEQVIVQIATMYGWILGCGAAIVVLQLVIAIIGVRGFKGNPPLHRRS